MKKVLLTGATGFVGMRLLSCLQKKNLEIVALSRQMIPNVDCIQCDFTQDTIPRNAFLGVDTVFHLAGIAHDFRSFEDIESDYRLVNVEATKKMAERATEFGVKKFVYISSIKAGGAPLKGVCMSEDDQNTPADLYGETKREAELFLLEIAKNSTLDISILRPSLVYGPNVKGNLKKMLSLMKKGFFPSLPDVGNRRSMIHVDDLVDALVLLATNPNANGKIFIATDGIGYSSRDIYEHLSHAVQKKSSRLYVPKVLFDLIGLLRPKSKSSLSKLFEDAYYSCDKLKSIGFSPQKKLLDINTTIYD